MNSLHFKLFFKFMKHIKCVVVGDDISEKTKLLISYATDDASEYNPTVFDNYEKQIIVDDQPVNLQLWDTSGQQDYKKLRPLSYPQTDIFIVTFALISPTSLEDVETFWVPEIREHCPGTPYILLGTFMTERNEFDKHRDEYTSKGWEPVPTQMGEEMMNTVLANDYFECDVLSKKKVEEVILKAVRLGLSGGSEPEKKKELLTIGLYGENEESKTKIALNYLLGDFHKGKIPIARESFFKVEYIDGNYINVTVDIENKTDLDDICAMIFIYDVGLTSLEKLKSLFDEVQKSNTEKKPYVLVLNYKSDKQEDAISDEDLDELIRDFQCNVCEIRNYSKEDIENVFYYLNQKMLEPFSNNKPSKRQMKSKSKSKWKKKK